MAHAPQDHLTTIVAANDKLLKALITLLSLKDSHLLEELTTVFAHASQVGADLGPAREETWRHVHRELAMIADLIDDNDAGSDGAVLDS